MLVTGFRIPELAYYGTNTRGLLAVSLFEMKSNVRVKKSTDISLCSQTQTESLAIQHTSYTICMNESVYTRVIYAR